MQIAKSYGIAVASTHASFADTAMLVRLAKIRSDLERLVVTNPVARFGSGRVLANYCHTICMSSCLSCRTIPSQDAGERLRADIEEIGADRCIVSTDFGQWTNPPPAEGMRMAIAAMIDAGTREADIATVVRTNPLASVGLSSD